MPDPQPDVSATELAGWADRLQSGLDHRKVEVFDAETGLRLRAGFEELGWHANELVWMVHHGPPPEVPGRFRAEPASDEEIRPLRLAWVDPPFTDEMVEAFLPTDEEVGRLLGARNLVLREDGEPVAYTRYLLLDGEADVQNVYVRPGSRGEGRGAALTAATTARAFADGAERVFILAEARGAARRLYARLGFEAAWTLVEFTRMPGEAA